MAFNFELITTSLLCVLIWGLVHTTILPLDTNVYSKFTDYDEYELGGPTVSFLSRSKRTFNAMCGRCTTNNYMNCCRTYGSCCQVLQRCPATNVMKCETLCRDGCLAGQWCCPYTRRYACCAWPLGESDTVPSATIPPETDSPSTATVETTTRTTTTTSAAPSATTVATTSESSTATTPATSAATTPAIATATTPAIATATTIAIATATTPVQTIGSIAVPTSSATTTVATPLTTASGPTSATTIAGTSVQTTTTSGTSAPTTTHAGSTGSIATSAPATTTRMSPTTVAGTTTTTRGSTSATTTRPSTTPLEELGEIENMPDEEVHTISHKRIVSQSPDPDTTTTVPTVNMEDVEPDLLVQDLDVDLEELKDDSTAQTDDDDHIEESTLTNCQKMKLTSTEISVSETEDERSYFPKTNLEQE